MPKFILAYHSNMTMPSTPEEGAAHRARYMDWMASLGDALVSPQNPFGPSQLVVAEGADEPERVLSALMGYSVVEAADMDAALAIARTCPFVEMGTIEVAPIKSMG